mgnify:CR=1 FL=1
MRYYFSPILQEIMSSKEDSDSHPVDSKLIVEIVKGKLRRLMWTKMESIHERLDRIEISQEQLSKRENHPPKREKQDVGI